MHPVILCQRGGDPAPDVGGKGRAMHQYDGRPFAQDAAGDTVAPVLERLPQLPLRRSARHNLPPRPYSVRFASDSSLAHIIEGGLHLLQRDAASRGQMALARPRSFLEHRQGHIRSRQRSDASRIRLASSGRYSLGPASSYCRSVKPFGIETRFKRCFPASFALARPLQDVRVNAPCFFLRFDFL
jgi:hypothetical protein